MSQIHRVLYDFEEEEEGEMTVRAGDIVKVLPQDENPDEDEDGRNGWIFVKATRTGRRGYVPLDYIEPTESPSASKSGGFRSSVPHINSSSSNKAEVNEPPDTATITPNRLPFTSQDAPSTNKGIDAPQTDTPDKGMRLSLASLVSSAQSKPKTESDDDAQDRRQLSDSTLENTPPINDANANHSVPPPPPSASELDSEDVQKQYGLDKKPFGMDIDDTYQSPRKGKGGLSLGGSVSSLAKSSASKSSKKSGWNKFKKSASMVQNMVRVSSAVAAPRAPSLASAVEREDWEELTKRNDEYFARLVSSQGETFDSLTDMVDALSKKLNEATKSSHDLVLKLTELDELIDDEKRKWKSRSDDEKNTEVLGKSKQLLSNSKEEHESESAKSSPRAYSPRGQFDPYAY